LSTQSRGCGEPDNYDLPFGEPEGSIEEDEGESEIVTSAANGVNSHGNKHSVREKILLL
jgi:hypothetical protein